MRLTSQKYAQSLMNEKNSLETPLAPTPSLTYKECFMYYDKRIKSHRKYQKAITDYFDLKEKFFFSFSNLHKCKFCSKIFS